MAWLDDDPLTQLAFSVAENKGLYALLLGSGLSRSAEIPTGWEITLDLIRRIATSQKVKDQPDWAKWYEKKYKEKPTYSALLEGLASSPEERRAIIHGYIEPNETDRAAGRKTPTTAHRAIAALVRSGHIRVIVTTNFDRLMESALRETGIEPTIISSVDALAGAEPLAHSSCYLVKLHGDYKDIRILNTNEELTAYPPQLNALLDRVLDEYGLIVAGWSGEWDHALKAAIMRAPTRRYSTFWTTRHSLGGAAQDLANHRKAKKLTIKDADSFFSTLQQKVEVLDKSRRDNPRSVELVISSAKRFLAKPEFRIQLDELIDNETERLLTKLDDPIFAPGNWSPEEFRQRVQNYESATEALASIAGVLGRWGNGEETPTILNIIRQLFSHAEKVGSGLTVHIELRSYPAILITTAYGLGLVRNSNWTVLNKFLSSTLSNKHDQIERVVDGAFLTAWDGGQKDCWQNIEGYERRKSPLSDHLFEVFDRWRRPFVGAIADFEPLFERLEILGMMVFLMRDNKEHLKSTIEKGDYAWMPFGRSLWDWSTSRKVIAELQEPEMRGGLLRAGFAKSDNEFFDLFFQNFGRLSSRSRY